MTAVLRVGLGILAAVAVMIGVWNQFFPAHFYANFPGVSLTPPFAEHYARDYGGATLGTAVVLIAASLIPRSVLVIPALLSVLAFALPHAWFHLHHVEHASPYIATVTVLLTVGQPLATLTLLMLALVRWRSERTTDRRSKMEA